MKLRDSICFLLAALAVVAILAVSCFRLNKDNTQLKQELNSYEQTKETQSEVAALAKETYYLVLEDGWITVYHKDGTVYLQTNISKEAIPQANLQELESGIYLDSLKEVYDYLESCSS